jgi:demethylmenaquinone methyltransferase/2-methoxy-6-polyprenyl-1,4-benzoquinol methylase
MGLELAVMAGLISGLVALKPRLNEYLVLVPVLLLGRAIYVGLAYVIYGFVGLPAAFMAGLSLLSGWPGLVLMVLAIPPVARLRRGRRAPAAPKDPARAKAAYFDGIARRWDGWEDLPALADKLGAGLEALGVGPGESVLDIGCGTGNLTGALLARLGRDGRVTAVDISRRMVRIARRKVRDPRVTWLVAGVERLPLPAASFDRVICYSVWPHLDDRPAVAAEIGRVLKPGGRVHVWHLSPREAIDRIHASAGGVIGNDRLPPAAETAALFRERGFRLLEVVDDAAGYLVDARLEAGPEA